MGCSSSTNLEVPDLPLADVQKFVAQKQKEVPSQIEKRDAALRKEMKQKGTEGVEIKDINVTLVDGKSSDDDVKKACVALVMEEDVRKDIKAQSWDTIKGQLEEELNKQAENMPAALRSKAIAKALEPVKKKHDQEVDKLVDQQKKDLLAKYGGAPSTDRRVSIFDQIDVDKSGGIDKRELIAWIRDERFRGNALFPESKALQTLVGKMEGLDKDADGLIDRQELDTFIETLNKDEVEEMLRILAHNTESTRQTVLPKIFKALDTNGDGKVDTNELLFWINNERSWRQIQDRMEGMTTGEKRSEIVRAIDANKDNEVTMEELEAFFKGWKLRHLRDIVDDQTHVQALHDYMREPTAENKARLKIAIADKKFTDPHEDKVEVDLAQQRDHPATKLFAKLDLNHDGFLDKQEILDWVSSETAFASQNADKKAQNFLKKMDRDKDGKVSATDFFLHFREWSAEELLNISRDAVQRYDDRITALPAHELQTMINHIFDLMDWDFSGMVEAGEAVWLVARLRESENPAIREKAETVIKEIDQDGNGVLSKAEIETYLNTWARADVRELTELADQWRDAVLELFNALQTHGEVSREAVTEWVKNESAFQRYSTERKAKAVYNKLDKSKDGHVTKTDFMHFFSSYSPSEIRALGQEAVARYKAVKAGTEEKKLTRLPTSHSTPDQPLTCAQLFDELDFENNGYLTARQVIQLMVRMQQEGSDQIRVKGERLYKELDADKDGTISIVEFEGHVSNWSPDVFQWIKDNALEWMRTVHALFQQLDHEQAGRLSIDDVLEWVKTEPAFSSDDADSKAAELMQKMDLTKSDHVNWTEFSNFFASYNLSELTNISQEALRSWREAKERAAKRRSDALAAAAAPAKADADAAPAASEADAVAEADAAPEADADAAPEADEADAAPEADAAAEADAVPEADAAPEADTAPEADADAAPEADADAAPEADAAK